jgi:hypothetical protein
MWNGVGVVRDKVPKLEDGDDSRSLGGAGAWLCRFCFSFVV